MRIEPAAEPRLVAERAQQPRRVVDEACVVEHANHARLEVGLAAVGIVQRVVGDCHRHRVDREVAPGEVLGQAGGLDVRQGTGLGVGLAPRGRDVDGQLRGTDSRSAEPVVLHHLATQPLGERPRDRERVALHHEVEIHVRRAAQQVPHRPAHQVGRRQTLEGGAEAGVHHSRTGMPAARIVSLASRTVYAP